MSTDHHRRFWCILGIAAIAAFVLTAAAQGRTTRPATPSGPMFASTLSRTASTPPMLVRTRSAAPPSAFVARVGANANPASYDDAAGDSGTAPDITSVVVSNDAGNQITFRINVAKLVVPSDGHVLIAIDTDQNASTGYHGIDYMFVGDLSTNSFAVARWSGSDFGETSDSTAGARTDDTGLTFSINSSELGNTTSFSFWARTIHGSDVSAGNYDDAPDQGAWDYQLGSTAPLRLSVGLSTVGKARAGKPFVAVIEVVRSDGADTTLNPGDVSCAARAGATPLKARTTVADGPAAGCGWLLPKKSRGKTLHASITAALDGATVTKTFTRKIR
jgi:hypothetical protein